MRLSVYRITGIALSKTIRKINSFLIGLSLPFFLSALPIDFLPEGPYHIASSNMEVLQPKSLSIDAYLVGNTDYGDPLYINSIMARPDLTLNITIQVPEDSALYGSYAGEPLSIVGFLIYPTSADNQRTDYLFPYNALNNPYFPRMDRMAEDVVPYAKGIQFPLVISSHGHQSHGIWDLAHLRYLSSHGYIGLSLFHGDGRIHDYDSRYALRPLMVKAFLDYLLSHPSYSPMIDPTRIGIYGNSFGGYTSLALLGAKYRGYENSVVDERIQAACITVPWVGNGSGDAPFLEDFSSLKSIKKPVLAVLGELDEVAHPDLALSALKQTSGQTIVYQIKGEEHGFTYPARQESQTLEVLFFDAYLKGSTVAQQILLGATYVDGEPIDEKIYQSLPRASEEKDSGQPDG